MNKYLKLLALACITFISTVVHAQNKTISIQSTLKNISGEAVPDGSHSITFKLWNVEAGGTNSPNLKWQETATVEVVSGIYSHELGSVVNLTAGIFSDQLYLGVTINGKELAPRTKLGYAPYALAVGSISGGGQSASFTSSGVFTVSQSQIVNDDIHIDNNAAIGFDGGTAPTSPAYALTIGDATTGISHSVAEELKIMTGGSTNAIFKKTTLDELVTIFPGRASFGTTLTPDKTVTLAIGDANTGLSGTKDTLEFITGGIEKMRIMPNGRVGIGTNDPKCPLHVESSNSLTGTSSDMTFFNYTNLTDLFWVNSGTNNITNISAYFDGNVVSGNAFFSALNVNWSDMRIKQNFVKSNSKADLNLLNKIEITEYDHIDKVNQDTRTQKKVIAQQVQDVLPNAVTKMRKVIPNVYALADKVQNHNGIMTITTPKPHNFLVGDKIDLKTDTKDIDEIEVLTVIDGNTFTVKYDVNTENVFVYGKYVDDFLTVDYDAISMLNVSATQELYRMVVDLQKANDNLLKENKSLKESSVSIEQRLSLLEQRLTSSNIQSASSIATDRK